MSENSRWFIKLHALLHDPPHKPLALGRGHERQGRSIAEALAGSKAPEDMWNAIKVADALASGADRESWLKDLQVDPKTELSVIHPLDARPILVPGSITGRALELSFSPELVDHVEETIARVVDVFSGIADERLRYLLVWRFTTDVLRALESGAEKHERRFRLGVLWDLLPADTRIPDHPLVFHDSLVAALAPIVYAKQDAALLRFAVGPVQPFIQSARKLRDLWAGSSILAEATWRAMLPFVEEQGPDCVLFPVLRGEPRFDRWLIDELKGIHLNEQLENVKRTTEDHLSRSLRIPSLPNVFTAVVPAPQAEELARRAQQAIASYWEEAVASAAVEAGDGDAFVRRAREQAKALLEVHWGVAPWPLVKDLSRHHLRGHPRWHRRTSHAEKAADNAVKLHNVLGGYQPNGGLFYPDSFEQSGMLLDDAKRERLHVTRDEGGLKCSVCGEREVLGPGSFWEQRHAGFTARKDSGKLSSGEQLCGPCTWKRHFDLDIGAFGARHPSTGEIAAARFKLDLFQRWRESPSLHAAMKAVVDCAQDAANAGGIEAGDLNVYAVQAVDSAARECGEPFVDEFARIDGQWLLPFPRDEAPEGRGQESAQAREARGKLIRAASRLRREAARAGIDPPRPYLAVVVFDGDEMGKWVSGTHTGFPRLWDVLHDKVKRQIEGMLPPDAHHVPRFLAPSFHATLSGVAATFSRYTAPMTLEGENLCGHLAYAGGDDVLFLAPIPEALELARRLRLRFSGWPGPFSAENGETTEVQPWVAVRLGKHGLPMPAGPDDDVDRLGLAFGSAATASAGMCVFHYRWPLREALEMARGAEKAAKGSGRNALGIVIQRRSGSITRTVIPFAAPRAPDDRRRSWNQADAPMTHFQTLVRLLADGQASPRLASLFRAEVTALHPDSPASDADSLWNMAEAVARRVVTRREVEATKHTKEELQSCVLRLGQAMRQRNPQVGLAIRDWSEAITAAAFLARPGD